MCVRSSNQSIYLIAYVLFIDSLSLSLSQAQSLAGAHSSSLPGASYPRSPPPSVFNALVGRVAHSSSSSKSQTSLRKDSSRACLPSAEHSSWMSRRPSSNACASLSAMMASFSSRQPARYICFWNMRAKSLVVWFGFGKLTPRTSSSRRLRYSSLRHFPEWDGSKNCFQNLIKWDFCT